MVAKKKAAKRGSAKKMARRRKAKTVTKPGQGDRGDRARRKKRT